MENIKLFFGLKNHRVNVMNSDISIHTAYKGFPRNTKLPNSSVSHRLERLIWRTLNVEDVCRYKIPDGYVANRLSNVTNPTMLKVLYDNTRKKIVGITIAHMKGGDLYVDLLCGMERKKNASVKQKGFGSILIDEIKKEGSILGAKYITLHSIEGAYNFYMRKGFSLRKENGNDVLLQLKVPPLSPSARNALLSQGFSTVSTRTTRQGVMIQSALRKISSPKKSPSSTKISPVKSLR